MDWNQRYQENDTPWERGEPAPPLVEFLEENQIVGRALVPGCGLGHDVRRIAAQGGEVVGTDIAELALQQASAFENPPGSKVSYALGDFLAPDDSLPASHFDWLFEHTCFCAIDPNRRPDYVAAAHRVLKPGGRLLAILFTDFENDDDPPYSIPSDAVEALFSPRFSIVRSWRPTRVFPDREGEETVFLMRRS